MVNEIKKIASSTNIRVLPTGIYIEKEILKKEPSCLNQKLEFIKKFNQITEEAIKMASIFDADKVRLNRGNDREKAEFCSQTIRPHLLETASVVEKIEVWVDHKFWQIPRITEMLFR